MTTGSDGTEIGVTPGTERRLLVKAPPPDTVDVWHASIAAADAAALSGVLSASEHARAARYRFEKDRRQFVVARGLLKCLAGRYLDQPPQDTLILSGPNGKPFVQAPLHFNVSHSGDAVVFAFASDRRVGIDIEWIDPGIDARGIAAKFFSPSEEQALASLPAGDLVANFFRCWVRKEAFLKGTGDALMRATSQFDVAVGPVSETALLSVSWDPEQAARWRVSDLAVREGFQAALAVEGVAAATLRPVPAIRNRGTPSACP